MYTFQASPKPNTMVCSAAPNLGAHMGSEGTDDGQSFGALLDSNYVMMTSNGRGQCSAPEQSGSGLPVPAGPSGGSPTRRVEIGVRKQGGRVKKGGRCNLPVIAESASLLTPSTSPNLPNLFLASPPGMALEVDGGAGGGDGDSRDEVSALVLRLRDERRGNLLLARRIKDLESVVREQETVLRETKSKIPKNPLEWGAAALDALGEADGAQWRVVESIGGKGSEEPSCKSSSDPSCQTQGETPSDSGTAEPGSAGNGTASAGQEKTKTEDEIENEETQAAKKGAWVYKIPSLAQENEWIKTASDKREQKHVQDVARMVDF